jgi:uncharacterized membrane protein (Fun14 family)
MLMIYEILNLVGLFLVGLAYLQYHHIANINWNKLQTILSEGAITTLANAIIMQIPGIAEIAAMLLQQPPPH